MWYPYQLSLCEFGYPLKSFVGKQLQHYIAIVVCGCDETMRDCTLLFSRALFNSPLLCVPTYRGTRIRVILCCNTTVQAIVQLFCNYGSSTIMGHLPIV